MREGCRPSTAWSLGITKPSTSVKVVSASSVVAQPAEDDESWLLITVTQPDGSEDSYAVPATKVFLDTAEMT